MKKLALHWKILIGMVVGILFGFGMTTVDGGATFVANWINPFGTIFVKLLKLIAIPLILASLVKGIADLKDISKFKSIGFRTVLIYTVTTIVAITIGLLVVNLVVPGNGIADETINKLTDAYANSGVVQSKLEEASKQKNAGPLQFLEDIVPDNVFAAMGDNANMLQVIFFTIFLGISMLLIGDKNAKPLKKFFDSLNEVVLKMVDIIMLIAPYAVFALLANVVVSTDDADLLFALLKYAGTVILGLLIVLPFTYCLSDLWQRKTRFGF